MITEKGKWGVNRAENGQKRCSRCLDTKSVSEFNVDNRRPDKLTRWCKKCVRIVMFETIERRKSVAPPAEKVCKECKSRKLSSEFFNSSRSPDKLWNKCKICVAPRRRKDWLKTAFGLSVADYEAMLNGQNGRCAICQQEFVGKKHRPFVDHDHRTGKVRGLLCCSCNLALGLLRDDPQRMRACADYVEKHHNA